MIVWFVPFVRSVVTSNIPGAEASREWATAYVETNVLLAAVGARLVELLEARGHRAASPAPTHQSDRTRLVSDWSHRHAAVAAGLGAFGHHNMLITASGCCGRLGSLATTLALEPDPRHVGEACLRCYEQCLKNGDRFRDFGTADVFGECLVGVPCSFTDPAAAASRPA